MLYVPFCGEILSHKYDQRCGEIQAKFLYYRDFAQKVILTCVFTASAPEEHHVYSLTIPMPVRSSGAPCALVRSVYMPLLTERDRSGIWSYKHVAPPEQEPSILMMTTFRAKPPSCQQRNFAGRPEGRPNSCSFEVKRSVCCAPATRPQLPQSECQPFHTGSTHHSM